MGWGKPLIPDTGWFPGNRVGAEPSTWLAVSGEELQPSGLTAGRHPFTVQFDGILSMSALSTS